MKVSSTCPASLPETWENTIRENRIGLNPFQVPSTSVLKVHSNQIPHCFSLACCTLLRLNCHRADINAKKPVQQNLNPAPYFVPYVLRRQLTRSIQPTNPRRLRLVSIMAAAAAPRPKNPSQLQNHYGGDGDDDLDVETDALWDHH